MKEDRVATHVTSYVAEFGEWLGTRDPTLLEVMAYYTDPTQTEALIASIDAVCAEVAEDLTMRGARTGDERFRLGLPE